MPKTHPITPQAEAQPLLPVGEAHGSAVAILFALSFCHLLNDAIQALIPALYPLVKESFKRWPKLNANRMPSAVACTSA